ncbi:jacalin-like lectin domain protein [Heliobacterium chlorum]|uniref:Jacalin-like lectin domain protein n=1 Tax=Heliobacterium chlorum TaxID=2698 RepID=A0ABR7T8Q6_HELCL|nr:jacalin-like lectin [Heliobacterium chlorum]MBC9786687.1 jacalin-like lectin domain protein [Heliobacterium chlorum]
MSNRKSTLFGGSGGDIFEDNLNQVVRMVKVEVYGCNYVDSIRTTYLLTDGSYRVDTHGGPGGSLAGTLTLSEDEYICYARIKYGIYVDNLVLATNKLTHLYAGGNGGDYTREFKEGKVEGFYGRSAIFIDAIGFLFIA